MITKELIKAEIDHIPLKDMETVYKLIKVFTLSTEDILNADKTRTQPDDTPNDMTRRLGSLHDSGEILGDIMTPIMDETQWEACNA